MIKKAKITISGKVQNVNYRFNTKNEAEKLGLTGYVQNKPDESVFIEVEGDQNSLDKLIKWCQNGPIHADVKKVSVSWHTATNDFTSFSINY